jgi:dUTP pyrophosphatase
VAIAEDAAVLEVALLHPDARLPERAGDGDAGYDLRALHGFTLTPGERRLVPTGIALALPRGVAGLVLPRSGLAARHGVTTLNAPGLIDPDYRGEVKVVLHNAGAELYEGNAGDRIAQLLLVPFWAPALRPAESLPPTARGAGGFGSTGR